MSKYEFTGEFDCDCEYEQECIRVCMEDQFIEIDKFRNTPFLWKLCCARFLAIFWNEIRTILTPSASEGGEWGRSRFSF